MTQRDVRSAGYSLIEVLVALAITMEVLLLALLLFDVNSRVSRVQTEVAEMQQAQRVANYDLLRTARLAGRGGLTQLAAAAVQDNTQNAVIGPNTVVDGTDILTVRGVFTNPILIASDFQYNSTTGNGQVTIDSKSTAGDIDQDLTALREVLNAGRPEALSITDIQDPTIYAVIQVLGGNIQPFDVNGDGRVDEGEERAQITFSNNPGAGTHNGTYLQLSSTPGGVPNGLRNASWVGIVEEYRYYIRASQTAAEGEGPRLSRARFFPNTNVVYDNNNANAGIDVADNVVDLQVALAVDLNGNGSVDADENNLENDEWLFNDPDDADSDKYWGVNDGDPAWSTARLFGLRLSTVVRSDRPDRTYVSERMVRLENRLYNEDVAPNTQDESYERSFRRRIMETTVDLRNIR